MPFPCKELAVTLHSGIELAVQIYGTRAESSINDPSENVLLLHGFLDNAGSFSKLAENLLKQNENQRLYCLDFSGHGLSSHKSRRKRNTMESQTNSAICYNLTDYVLECIELISILGWDKFGIIGHSMGGGVAMMLASAMQSKVTRLVIIDSFGPWTTDAENAADTLAKSVQFRATPTSTFNNLAEAAAHRAKKNFIGTMTLEDATALAMRGTKYDNSKRKVYWVYDPYLKRPSPTRFTEESIQSFLNNITAPSLLIWTEDGLYKDIPGILFQYGVFSSFVCFVVISLLRFASIFSSKSKPATSISSKPTSAQMLKMAVILASRIRLLLQLPQWSLVQLKHGGHHVHMSRADVVADTITMFYDTNPV